MAGTFSKSFQLVKESFSILRKDKEIVWFPIISSILAIIFVAVFILVSVDVKTGELEEGYFYYLKLFICYLLVSFVSSFFYAGLLTCSYIRLNGGDPTFNDGFKNAANHIGKIFLWALVSATIGVILAMIAGRGRNNLRKRAAETAAIAWGFLVSFVIPLIIFEEKSIYQAMKGSVNLFKKTWGENITAQFSIGFIFGILTLIGFIPLFIVPFAILIDAGPENIVVSIQWLTLFVIAYSLILGIISSALNGIFIATLYRYVTTGEISPGFNPEFIKNAFKPNQLTNF